MDMKIYRTAQEIYRGDPSPIDLADFDADYGRKELGKDLGSSAAWGPGIYFTGQKDIAEMYGPNVTKKFLKNSNILTKQSPLFSYDQVGKMLDGVGQNKVEEAIFNWDEDYNIGRRLLINSIINEDNPLDQIMNIWAEVFYHQDPNAFMDFMVKNGIDGIFIQKAEDETYYVIYNKELLI
ncbi:MAG: hypothetical protein WC119_01920 [Synergistaceae bacterium]